MIKEDDGKYIVVINVSCHELNDEIPVHVEIEQLEQFCKNARRLIQKDIAAQARKEIEKA